MKNRTNWQRGVLIYPDEESFRRSESLPDTQIDQQEIKQKIKKELSDNIFPKEDIGRRKQKRKEVKLIKERMKAELMK